MYSVYRITNIKNGRIYIGSTSNFEIRRSEHLAHLRKGKHVNRFLQSDFKIYGEQSFLFEVIHDGFISRQQMLLKEYELILKTKKFNYNIHTDCSIIIPSKIKRVKSTAKPKDYPYRVESKKYQKGERKAHLKAKFKNIFPNLTAIAERKRIRESRLTA